MIYPHLKLGDEDAAMLHRLSDGRVAHVVNPDRRQALLTLKAKGWARCWPEDGGKPHLEPMLCGQITTDGLKAIQAG